MLKDFAKVDPNFQIISLRYFNPVGADESGLNGENPINKPTALVPFIVKVASGEYEKLTIFGTDYKTRDGSCIRDYIHVTDLANAHIKALEFLQKGENKTNYDVFNIGSGDGVTVLEAIHAFEEHCGQKLNYEMGERRPGDVEAIYSNSAKAKELLGWTPKLGIKEMMQSAWKWEEQLGK
jgi:UDP-glucose 4-epimerase